MSGRLGECVHYPEAAAQPSPASGGRHATRSGGKQT
jgi:hypothetical protein